MHSSGSASSVSTSGNIIPTVDFDLSIITLSCRIPTLPLIFPFTYPLPHPQRRPHSRFSFQRAQLRSYYWFNFYPTARRPALLWPQVVHDSFRSVIHVINDCHVQSFRRRIIRRDSLCSRHCSRRSILTFPTVPTYMCLHLIRRDLLSGSKLD